MFFILALMYFTPKQSLYYFFESLLVPHAVIISSEVVHDRGFTLDIENANLSFKSIESATIAEINLKLFALYNAVDLKNITLSSAVKSFFPQHVEVAKVRYTILNPLHVKANIIGEFGEADVKFHLFERSLHIELLPSPKMLKEYQNTLQNMSKNESGRYVYDKNI